MTGRADGVLLWSRTITLRWTNKQLSGLILQPGSPGGRHAKGELPSSCSRAGNSTSDTACKFRLSASRVSQLRRELHHNWLQFQKAEEPLPPIASRSRMKPSQIDRAVSRATGELGPHEISHRGFSLADLIEVGDDPESDGSPQVVDWDALYGATAQPVPDAIYHTHQFFGRRLLPPVPAVFIPLTWRQSQWIYYSGFC